MLSMYGYNASDDMVESEMCFAQLYYRIGHGIIINVGNFL